MAFSFRCTQCGRVHTTSAQSAGKVVNCEGCGKAIRVPVPRQPARAPAVPRANAPVKEELDREDEPEPLASFPRDSPRRNLGNRSATAKAGGLSPAVIGGLAAAGTVLVLMVLFGIGAYRSSRRSDGSRAPQAADASPTQPATRTADAAPNTPRPIPVTDRGSSSISMLPEPGQGVELEPGVLFFEVHLPGSRNPGVGAPGQSGKLWLYLPAGNHAHHSLPCIVIAGAGSNLITGMDLGDGDRPEHLPYVREGFAVLAYELDGALPDPKPTNDAEFAKYIRSFVAAEAGLVNMRVAVEYATTRVPVIDPDRLFAVGHSSAATLALLVAENEPRIAACVAFAPVVDIRSFIPAPAQQAVTRLVPGAAQIFTRFNPAEHVAKLKCPLFLFVAQDDTIAPVDPIRDLARQVRQTGTYALLVTVPAGGHHAPMIRTGIPRAIRWLKELRRGADGSIVVPKNAPAPESKKQTRNPGPNQKGPRGKGGRRPGGTDSVPF